MKKLIQISGLVNRFGQHTVHDGIDLAIYQGEILGIVGGSGSGKSVLLHSMLGLHTPTAGSIELFGNDIAEGTQENLGVCQKRWGVLFQTGALFSGLTVLENVLTPIVEHTNMSKCLAEELACLKLVMVG